MSFEIHLKIVLTNVNETTGLLEKLQKILPRTSLITKCKVFRRPHLDHGDIVFDQALNNSFHGRLEPIRCKAALVRTGSIGRTSNKGFIKKLVWSHGNSDDGSDKYFFFFFQNKKNKHINICLYNLHILLVTLKLDFH